jgi:hypothetical protein
MLVAACGWRDDLACGIYLRECGGVALLAVFLYFSSIPALRESLNPYDY